MLIFVKVGTNPSIITRVELHQTDVYENDSTWIKLDNTKIDPKTGEITLSDNNTKISFKEFIKGIRLYSVSADGIISRNENADDVVEQNTDVPMSFTRANTVVNLGRL